MQTPIPQLETRQFQPEETERTEVSNQGVFSVTSVNSCSSLNLVAADVSPLKLPGGEIRADSRRLLHPKRTALAAREHKEHKAEESGLCALCVLLWLTLFGTGNGLAATRYVWQQSPSPAPPYTNWATAATNIQDAVDAALAGDNVLVAGGVYSSGGRAVYGTMTNRVAVDRAISVESLMGPEVTIIHGAKAVGGGNGDGAIRCVYLTSGASLSGFTLTNGATRAVYDYPTYHESRSGGVWCESTNVVITNCFIVANSSATHGGGAYGGTLNNCTLITNDSFWSGGGAAFCMLKNCSLTGNSAGYEGGGGAYQSTLNNCILTGNTVLRYGGDGGGARSATLNNCTLTLNRAIKGGGAIYCTLNNCIIFGNSSSATGVPNGNHYSSTLNYCYTTTPLPTNGIGNIFFTALPFVNSLGGNYRLQSNAPCINAGRNGYVTSGTDPDGNPRIVGGTVDMGAYEFQSPGSVLSYAWAQQYGLPTDGSVDYADADQDGHNNWQEWRAWTIPTDALSVLKLLTPQPATNGMLVRWQSVSGHSYSLERAANAGTPFSLLQSNIVGQAGTTSFTDTNTAGLGTSVYRVRVQ